MYTYSWLLFISKQINIGIKDTNSIRGLKSSILNVFVCVCVCSHILMVGTYPVEELREEMFSTWMEQETHSHQGTPLKVCMSVKKCERLNYVFEFN